MKFLTVKNAPALTYILPQKQKFSNKISRQQILTLDKSVQLDVAQMLGIFPIEISVTLLKKIQKNLLFINPGQSHELDEIQKRQLIFNLREMSNPLNFGNCVVAFLEHRRSIWIVSSGGFYEKILGVSRSRRLRLTTEAALEEIEGGRGRVWGCTAQCLADEIFFVNDGDQGSLTSCVKQECA